MRKIVSKIILIISIIFVCYITVSFVLQNKLKQTYEATHQKLNNYQKWGLNTNEFVMLALSVHPYLQVQNSIYMPIEYSNKKTLLERVILLADQHYANESIKNTNELLNKVGYVRDRIVKSDDLPQDFSVSILQQIQNVSGTVFESKPTLQTIIAAKQSIDSIDVTINAQMEKVRKDSLHAELQKYKMRCEEDEIFFIQRKSLAGQKITDRCYNEIDALHTQDYLNTNLSTLSSIVRERIFATVAESEKLRNQLYQNELFSELEKRKLHERLTLVPPPAVSTGKVIVINIAIQRLYAYDNGKSIFSHAVPITSGKNGFETVTGEFAIYYKQRNFRMTSPFPGIYYDNVVDYWMPFYLGYGIHDASWRTVYGTQDYPSVGSHGCVNTPLTEVAVLYNWADVGTKVIVY